MHRFRIRRSAGLLAAAAFFSLASALADDPPRIDAPDSVAAFAGDRLPPIWIAVADDDAPPENIEIRLESGDPDWIGVSPERALGPGIEASLTPKLDRTGSTFLRVITAEGAKASERIVAVSIHPPVFSKPGAAIPGRSSAGGPAWADFDGDGWMDLLYSDAARQTNAGLLRNERGSLVPTALLPAGLQGGAVDWGDTDGDGDLDLFISGTASGRVAAWIFRNDGQSFAPVPLPLPISSGLGRFSDFDLDGDLDLVLSGPSYARFLRNDGMNVFVVLPPLPFPSASTLLDLADIDGDGDEDLLLRRAFSLSIQIRVFRNDLNFRFVETPLFVGEEPMAAGWRDWNSDGRPDLWTGGDWRAGNEGGRQGLRVFPNLGGGQFGPPESISGPRGEMLWLDFDADGDLDIVARPFRERSFGVYRRQSGGVFEALGEIPFAMETLSFTAADLNRDGLPELAIVAGTNGLALLTNLTAAVNPLPRAPGGLRAAREGSMVRFSWDAAADVNQAGGLTYNLRAGSKPGANDIVPSMSLPSGQRLLPKGGNAGGSLSLAITNISAEAVYWSVQSVDNGFAGSPFAPERILVLDPAAEPPKIGPVADAVIDEDHALAFSFTVADDKTAPEHLRVSVVSDSPQLFRVGSAELQREGSQWSIRWTPVTNAYGAARMMIEAVDEVGLAASASFAVVVRSVNDPPVARSFRTWVEEDASRFLFLGGSDAEGDALRIRIVRPPRHGSLSVRDDQQVIYQPSTNYFGLDSFTYVLRDDNTYSSEALVRMVVRPATFPPAPVCVIDRSDETIQVAAFVKTLFSWERFRVLTSTNLVQWTSTDHLSHESGVLYIEESFASEAPRKFYRFEGLGPPLIDP